MAFDVGKLQATLELNKKNFDKGIKGTKKGLGSFKDSVGNVGTSVFNLQNAVVGLAGAAGLGLLAKNAVTAAIDMEQTNLAFEVMLGSAEEANKLMKDMTEFAKTTPFNRKDLIEGAKKLSAYGVEADKIVDTMGMLGDITAGVGKDKLPQLILAFGQVKAATKLTGSELRQFSEAGVPVLEALVNKANESGGALQKVGGASKSEAKKINKLSSSIASAEFEMRFFRKEGGKTEKQLQSMQKRVDLNKAKLAEFGDVGQASYVRVKQTAADMIDRISDGQVTFEDLQDALMGMTQEGGKFENMMERLSATAGGRLSNLQDNIEILTLALGASLLPVIEPVINKLLDMTDLFLEISEGTVSLSDAFNNFSSNFAKKAESLGVPIELLTEIFKPFASVIKQIVSLFWNADEGFSTFGNRISEMLGDQRIEQLKDSFLQLIQGLSNNFKQFLQFLEDIDFAEWFEDKFKQVADILILFGMFWNKWGDEIVGVALFFLRRLWNTFSTTVDIILGVVQAGLQLLMGDWKGAFETLEKTAKTIFERIVKFFTDTFGDIGEKIEKFREKIAEALNMDKRNSPSINDRLSMLRSGIQGTLNDIAVPDFSASIAGSLDLAGAGSNFNQNVNIKTGDIRNGADISSITRELAFRTQLQPGFKG